MQQQIETKRLILRSFQLSDAEKCFRNFAGDKELGRFLPMYPMQKLSQMQELVAGFTDSPDVWLITDKLTEEPMGYTTIDIPYPSLEVGELAYLLGEKFQKKGYAFEAEQALLQYLFEVKKLYLVEAKYNSQNEASGRLLTKLEFKQDGVLRGRRIDLSTGQRCDMVVCSLLKTEYEGEKLHG